MKVTTYETLYMKNMVLLWSTIYETCYIMVLVWSTSVEKRIVVLSPFLWAFFFSLAFLFFFFYLGQCSIDWWSSHFYLFTTQLLQLDTRTKYDSIWMPPAVYRDMQWIKSDMYEKWMVALPQIRCQLHDHAKSNMTMMERVIITERWKVAWQYCWGT